ncbi:hypothetical protein MTE1_5361 [Klebsiella pneumoniae JHCK1]|nr:hypothetical protein MTE1_5361 [Klebsiella pneumoniae JHCK1]
MRLYLRQLFLAYFHLYPLVWLLQALQNQSPLPFPAQPPRPDAVSPVLRRFLYAPRGFPPEIPYQGDNARTYGEL